MIPSIRWQELLASLLFLAIAGQAWSEPTASKSSPDPAALSRYIDQEIDKTLQESKVPPSPPADDAEFMRRVYLDITGRIPTGQKARDFLDSKDPDKRSKLVNELLVSQEYGQNFAIIWRDLIVKGDENNQYMNVSKFVDWLAAGFSKGRGWNDMVFDMLTADGNSAEKPQGVFFLSNREMSRVAPSKVVIAVSKLFMGTQLQCAECHNHPFIKNWKQDDFWGTVAFFNQVKNQGQVRKGPPADVTVYESYDVLGKGGVKSKKPPMGLVQPPGAAVAVPHPNDPDKSIRVVKARFIEGESPQLGEKGPYRPVFARWLTSAENKFFARAAVNRWWGHFFARGIIDPVDEISDDNPGSHPELLAGMAREFAAAGFDFKFLIRAICGSRAYQRSSKPLPGNKDDKTFSRQNVKVMTAEMLYDSLLVALGTKDLLPHGLSGNSKSGSARAAYRTYGREFFVKFFDPKEESDPDLTDNGHGIPQFLRLMNGERFNESCPVVEKAMKEGSQEDVLENLYLAALARRPTGKEKKKLADYLATEKDAAKGYNGVYWILLNSAEFVCNR